MKLLFMCVANSARSQIAEGLAKKIFPNAEIESAGSAPGRLNPYAVTVMHEIGIDITRQYSKSTGDLPTSFVRGLDYIITLCAEEVCPTVFSQHAEKLHWPLPDPATKEAIPEIEALARFRQARDMIEARLKNLQLELTS